jgi:uncharacterized damage-inducible protein DinB
MNYYGAKDLADNFRTVRKNTLIIADDIGEQHYGFRAAPDVRTVGQTLVHISMAPKFQEMIHGERRTGMEGIDFPKLFATMSAEEQKPRKKAEVIALLREEGERFAKWLDGLSDDFLAERVKLMPGMTPTSKTRFEMLLGVKEHEMHHRGQLMLVERIIGVVPHLTREMQQRMAAMGTSGAARPAQA